MLGGIESYRSCQDYAHARRQDGVSAMVAPSAAVQPGAARGQFTDAGLREAGDRSGVVWVLFGRRPELRAWRVVERGAPPERILTLVRHVS